MVRQCSLFGKDEMHLDDSQDIMGTIAPHMEWSVTTERRVSASQIM